MFFLLLFLWLDFSLEILDFISVFLSGVDFEELQDSHSLEYFLQEILDVSFGQAKSAGDDDVLVSLLNYGDVGAQVSLEVVDLHASLQIVDDFLGIDKSVFDGDSQIDVELELFHADWVFGDFLDHGL